MFRQGRGQQPEKRQQDHPGTGKERLISGQTPWKDQAGINTYGSKNRIPKCRGGGEIRGQHAWPEFCKEKDIFVGEVFVPRNGTGTINMAGYELVTEVKKGETSRDSLGTLEKIFNARVRSHKSVLLGKTF